jgi:hypothetical protein
MMCYNPDASCGAQMETNPPSTSYSFGVYEFAATCICRTRGLQHGKGETKHEKADCTSAYLSLRMTQIHTRLQEEVKCTIAKLE